MNSVERTDLGGADIAVVMAELGRKARAAAARLATTPAETKARALRAAADALLARQNDIIAANALDMAAGREAGLSKALLDRLDLTPQRIEGGCRGLARHRRSARSRWHRHGRMGPA